MLLSALALLLGIAPAQADTAPRILPDRDLAATYRFNAPGRPEQTYRLEYDARDRRARINDPAQGTWFLVDLRKGTAELVVPQLKSVVETSDFSRLTRQLTDAGRYAKFSPLAKRQYAGLTCRDWLIVSKQGEATVCLTPGGVTLHFKGSDGHGAATVTATAVSFTPQPAAEFVPPAGYTSVHLPPAMLRALVNGGPA